jgi:hypothetical protein
MALVTPRELDRARTAQEDAEVLRDHALTLAYQASVLRSESAALRAQAEQIRRRVRADRTARRRPVA